MFLLQIISDYGYDGCDIHNICVSNTSEKLDEIRNKVETELRERTDGFRVLLETHNMEYEPLRENKHSRTSDELMIWHNKVNQFYNSFPTITKLGINSISYDRGISTFNISEIKVV